MVERQPPLGYADARDAKQLFSHLNAWLKGNCILEFSDNTQRLSGPQHEDMLAVSGDRPAYRFDASLRDMNRQVISPLQIDTNQPASIVGYPQCVAHGATEDGAQFKEYMLPRLQVTTRKRSVLRSVAETLILEATPKGDIGRLIRARQMMVSEDTPGTEEFTAAMPGNSNWLTAAEIRFLGELTTMLYIEDPDMFRYEP